MKQDDAKQDQSKTIDKRIVYGLLAAFVVAVGVIVWLMWQRPTTEPTTLDQQSDDITKPVIKDTKTDTKQSTAVDCGTLRQFAGKTFGAQFCYPNAWGEATPADAKLASSDTGSRQIVSFADMPLVKVGGVSDDWSTTVGRDGACFDPGNQVPALSSYNTAWHDQVGSGADIEFAVRSLPSLEGGYALTEEVSNVLSSGICARGYKVINGSRYRVLSASFYRDFAPASGIVTPAQHIAEPNVLFSTELRAQFDALVASMRSYE
jgi:hypothetical protein